MLALDASLGTTVLWCSVTAALGWWFARGEDFSLWTLLEADLANGRVPTEEGVDALLELLGAWGLISPGVLTDLVGALLLVPPVRGMAVGPIRELLRSRLHGSGP